MKKLLTTITLSALVGTSASNLKPIFTNNVVSNGFKSNQINNKDISIQNENDTNPFDFYKINNTENITKVRIDKNGTIWIGTYTGLYKSTDGNIFTAMSGVKGRIHSLAVDKDNNVYVGTDKGLYITNPINLLLKITKPPILLINLDHYTSNIALFKYCALKSVMFSNLCNLQK